MALNALLNMKSFKDIKAGQHQLELSVTRVQAGLEHLEQVSMVSSGIKIPEGLPEIPQEVILAMDSLEKSLECIARFTENSVVDEIRTALQKLDDARGSLGLYLERIDSGVEASGTAQSDADTAPAQAEAEVPPPQEIQPGTLDVKS